MRVLSRTCRATSPLSRWLLVAAATLVLPGSVPILAGSVRAPIIDRAVAERMAPGRDLPVILVARDDLAQLEGDLQRVGVHAGVATPFVHGVAATLPTAL